MPAPSQAAEAVGAVLNGQWKLVRLVGEGGLAAVYEAHGLQGQGRRAVKLLHRHFSTQPGVVERFYAEAKACFTLRHPHISAVEAYAYAEDGTPYLVMELLEGTSLAGYLARGQPMSVAQAAPLIYGVLQALSVAHARSIVHRDLKPDNVFLVPDGRGGHLVKVLDFGVAKVVDIAGGFGGKTCTGAMLGTPGYMSPEQIKDAKTVDARSDLWAVAVVYYEMLSCRHPWQTGDPLERTVAVLRDPHVPLGRIRPELWPWDPFFARALERDPAARFQSAKEMAGELRALAQAPAPGAPAAAEQTPAPAASRGATVSIPLVQLAPPAGAAPATGTQISEQMPSGTAPIVSEPAEVAVVTARGARGPQLVWWAVALVALGAFVLGVAVGYALGAG
ncbi:MAG: serine/threonine protein kinase [Deltaproteobacteria bacterium]|nr:serine/threonine protein kinase [Deltaproteobacteria bacterium]